MSEQVIETNKEIQPRRRGFQKGQSGNPKGKPKGAISHHTRLVAQLAADDVKEVVAAISAKAKDGDVRAAELVLRYAAPLPKGRLVRFEMPEINTVHDVHVALNGLWSAISSGQVTPDEGETLGRLLAQHAAVLESSEIERRLAALEAAEEKRAA